ncbi:GntR family transcriptional regulator [Caldilinea sp.]|uniref:GntR family transcriptional regulator n=1 Tax=Caldilinea sp. TaxID=2293560 RepID=UPI002C836E31|nr:GntR family transcriptional regulator [Caldilinea sp.]HRA65790.1 GntR family transcriptional regulator [Caldilinea sp.]
MIDKNSPVPLYYQIAEQLKEQIATGELASGSRLPSERELSEQTGVSRMTVRQALNYLQRDGLLAVRQGVGAFVAQDKHTYDALHLLGFSEEIGRRGDSVESVVLEQVVVSPPTRVAQQLAVDEHCKTVKIMRVRRVNQEPMLLETSYIPSPLCPGLEAVDLATNSLYAVLESHYGLQLHRARQTMECVAATDYEQSLFDLRSGAAVLLLEGVTYDAHEAPVEYFKAIYRGDRCKFQLESWRNRGATEVNATQRMSVVVR